MKFLIISKWDTLCCVQGRLMSRCGFKSHGRCVYAIACSRHNLKVKDHWIRSRSSNNWKSLSSISPRKIVVSTSTWTKMCKINFYNFHEIILSDQNTYFLKSVKVEVDWGQVNIFPKIQTLLTRKWLQISITLLLLAYRNMGTLFRMI